MKEYQSKEVGSNDQQLIRQHKPYEQEQASHKEGIANTSLAPLIDQEILDKLGLIPPGEDPVFWPIRALENLNHRINTRHIPGDFNNYLIGTKYAPLQETIQKVKTAYSILAYPYCKDWTYQTEIEAALEVDYKINGRNQIELTADESRILSKIAAARKIPFNREKLVYSYSEAPIVP